MAYYNVLFDRAVDEVFELIGCGLDYVKACRHSCFTAEVHVRYLRELSAGDPVRLTFQLLDFDSKRMHLLRTALSCRRGLGISHFRKHVAACRYERPKDRRLPVGCRLLPRPL